MSIVDRFLTQPATLHRRTVDEDDRDDLNQPTVTETDEDVLVYIEQASVDEDTAGTDQQTQTFDVYLAAGTDVSGVDALTVAGVRLEVFGPPWAAVNPLMGGLPAFVQIKVRGVR